MTNSDYFNFITCYDDGNERQPVPPNLTENSSTKTKESTSLKDDVDSYDEDDEDDESTYSDELSKAIQSLCLMQIRKDMNPKY